jgi:ketosteroid isomerase-like protein
MSVLNKDVDGLLSLYSSDFVAFDMWGPWCHIGEVVWREMNQEWLSSLGSESVTVEFHDIRTIPGSEVAAAYATVSYKAISETGEILRSMENRLTWVAKRENGGWKIIHQHTSAPITPGTLTAVLHR